MTPPQVFKRALGLGPPPETAASPEAANLRNMLLLSQLRWVAVVGQLATILVTQWGLGIRLPLGWLLVAPLTLAAINLVSVPVLMRRRGASNQELWLALLVDVSALTWLLFLTGGATNPFVTLYLLQVVLAAVLLRSAYAWAITLVTSVCFLGLALFHRPLDLSARGPQAMFPLYIEGSLISFLLVAVLLVLFVTRISRNLRARDAYLADLRQQAAEQVHIVRMGLLASGAAHELGTPLATLAVILSDWKRMPVFSKDRELAEDIAGMQAEVERCKTIVSGILMSAGEARGEAPVRSTVGRFFGEVVSDWRAKTSAVAVTLTTDGSETTPIVADPALKQVFSALLDNAAEAGAKHVEIAAGQEGEALVVTFRDDGGGFSPEVLARFGQPYQSTKGRPGAGLGLFLLVNVLRTLGGSASARNRAQGGAELRLVLPAAALALEEGADA